MPYQRRSYSTDFKLAVNLNIVSKSIVSSLPRRSIANFKYYDFNKLFGLSYSKDKLEVAKSVISSKTLYQFNKAVLYIKNTLINIYSIFMPDFIKLIKKHNIRNKVISVIKRTGDIIGFNRVLKYFHISRNTFYNWSNSKKCSDSIISRCFKQHPSQLTKTETNKIKEVFQTPITKFWPVISIYYYALRNNIISIGERTFYKYSAILGLSRPMPQHCRKKHTTGIRATAPNKLLHADVTIFRTLDNIKNYIYIIMDNFSRKILNFKVSLTLSAQTSFNCLKETYEKYILPLTDKQTVQLMVDGGIEINNNTVDSYIAQKEISIEKIIAQQDVSFSNSMIEAVNKIVKYNYLFKTEIPDHEALVTYLNEYIPNYNARYHVSLDGLSPDEAYSGIALDKDKIKDQLSKAKQLRLLENRKNLCQTHNQ